MEKNRTVDEFISKHTEWKSELDALRKIIAKSELKETIKWGIPTYTFNNKNVLGLGAFKSYVGIWFFQGVFLKDSAKKLINAQEGKTQGMRQWRFNSMEEIDEKLILEYIKEAIQNQKEGKEIKPDRKKELSIPPVLQNELDSNYSFKESFEKITPGKQREYAEYISEAKQESTKLKRLQKITPMIEQGVGLNDKYK